MKQVGIIEKKCNHEENSDTDCMLVSKDTNEKLGENKLDIFIRRTKESVSKRFV